MKWVTDTDIVSSVLRDESGLTGHAEALVRPVTTAEVQDVVRECQGRGLPLLPVGRQTATTGAAVPQGGVVCAMTGMSGVLDIREEVRCMEVLPGTVTADVKSAAASAGLYYPPDPTSENESTIGGNAATNASGARTFRWGMTADWVEALEVVLGTGEVRTVARRRVDKNTAGYAPFLDPVSLFLGSEGTLGVITKLWLRVIPDPGPFVACLVFFPSLRKAIEAAVDLRQHRGQPSSPRCVELFDHHAMGFLPSAPRPPSVPTPARSALYLEFDVRERPLERLVCEDLAPLSGWGALLDDTVLAETREERNRIRTWRHHIPETCNRLAAESHAQGGLKVSAEFAVPPDRFLEMMDFVDRTAMDAGVDLLVRYGHVGNGHPHVFTRGRSPEEVARLKQLSLTWVRHAVSLGGTASGEHGIGKSRRDFLPLMYPPEVLQSMRALKKTFDPAHILARGNLFPDTPSLVPEFFG